MLGYKYYYDDDFDEHTGRVTFAQHITPATAGLNRSRTASSLDRSYGYDNAGRLAIADAGVEARAHAFTWQWGSPDGNYSQGFDYDVNIDETVTVSSGSEGVRGWAFGGTRMRINSAILLGQFET